jgi:predicted metalloprotease with PDZ domain
MFPMKIKHLAAALIVAGLTVVAVPAFASAGPQPVPNEFTLPAPKDVAYPGTLQLHVDATDLVHRIFRVHETIPVSAGSLFLLYPQWIPGDHEPSGPIDDFAGLTITAHGQTLDWERDPANVYAFHVDVPQGVSSLDVTFEFLSAHNEREGRVMMTPQMLSLQWNTVVLYPAGYFVRNIPVRASVTLPQDFQFATALDTDSQSGNQVSFKTIDFENLADSPMIAGKYFKRIDLAPGAQVPVHLDVVADQAKDLEITPEEISIHQALVSQMKKRYGAQHYNHYDFLLSLTDNLGEIGLEHSRSSENSADPGYFSDWKKNWVDRDLLPHEYNHSWDGKYRRPQRIWIPNFNVPMRDHGLWVYEGYTQYSGYVMAARSGLWSKDQAMDMLALLGATYDRGRPGMAWRTIWDTTNDPTIAQRAALPYSNYQMSEDYYSGGQLIWLALDAKIRSLTGNKKNLVDFDRAFFGINDGAWDINTFSFDDVVNTLNKVTPFDWKSFIDQRLKGHGNLSKAFDDEGWTLVYTDKPSDAITAMESEHHTADLTYSLGMSVLKNGSMHDVLWNSPAFKAGLAPSMTIVAVNGTDYSPDVLEDAVTAAKGGTAPITLLVKEFDAYKTIAIDYHGGLQYPKLERIEGKPDYLSQVLAPMK